MVTLTIDNFGVFKGETVRKYTWLTKSGFSVSTISYGAIIQSIKVPDRNGITKDVVLGFDDLESYVNRNTPYLGATVGRCANRIGGATFEIDGVRYHVAKRINDELAAHRIIVKDISEDLYDGQVLQKLLEVLTGTKLDVPEVTQSEEGQRQKLAIVLRAVNRVLYGTSKPVPKWSVDSIHSKNIVSILHLLVALARHFRAPIRLPENVTVNVVVAKKDTANQLSHRTLIETITTTYDELGMKCERDAFDALFDHAPDKLQVVKKSLITFVNKHLSKVNLEVMDLDSQFHDGVYLVLLMGLLEGFFVPLYDFHLTPEDFDQKVHNVSFAFELMQDVGLAKPKARPEDIVNLDLKSTLRVLYNLFTKYKSMA